MAKVGIALCTAYLDARHPVALVPVFSNRLIGDRLPVAGPAGSGIILFPGAEQGGMANNAMVSTIRLVVIETARKCPFGARLLGYPILLLGEGVPEFLVAFLVHD